MNCESSRFHHPPKAVALPRALQSFAKYTDDSRMHRNRFAVSIRRRLVSNANDTEENIMRNRQIRSALDGVVLILSAVLFTLLALVSCKSEMKPGTMPLEPPPAGRNAVAQQPKDVPSYPVMPPPPAPPASVAKTVYGGVEGGVVGGVAGGVIGGYPAEARAMRANVDAADFNTEEYGRIQENEFLAVADNPLSTFSVDVDRAAYSNIRRFLRDGQRPPRDAVRIEEMVNYFTYDYPDPSGAQPFSVTTEVAACPWNERHRVLLVGLQGRRMKTADLPANNLTFLIDVSGSMMSPDKLPLVKEGLELLVNQLRPKDRVAIVVYAGNADSCCRRRPALTRERFSPPSSRSKRAVQPPAARASSWRTKWRNRTSSTAATTA